MFRRKEMVLDVSQYLLYEAADAALRVENCKLDLKIMLKTPLAMLTATGR